MIESIYELYRVVNLKTGIWQKMLPLVYALYRTIDIYVIREGFSIATKINQNYLLWLLAPLLVNDENFLKIGKKAAFVGSISARVFFEIHIRKSPYSSMECYKRFYFIAPM